jgi:hypothetical protein
MLDSRGEKVAATLTTTLSAHLAGALPDPTEREEVAATIIRNANPRAYAAGRSGPAGRSNISMPPRRKRSWRQPTTTSSRASASASQRLWCYSPSCSPPASPGFPAARAPSRTPSVRRKRSRRRRPPARALFRSRAVAKWSPSLYSLNSLQLCQNYMMLCVRIGKLNRSASNAYSGEGNACALVGVIRFFYSSNIQSSTKQKKPFIFSAVQRNRELKVLCSCHSIAVATEATRFAS